MKLISPLGIINLLIVITSLPLNCDLAAAPDPNKESLEILKHLQSSMRSMEARLGHLETKLSPVNLVQGKVDEVGTAVTVIGGKVERMESILNKLQLTDQERKKWCNTEYGQSLFSLHKTESESVRRQMSSMLQEISELIRSGMGKLLIRMDSLLTVETSKSTNPLISSNGNYKPSTSSSSSKLPSPSSTSLPSTGSTNSRAGYELSGSDETINRGGGSGNDNQITVTLVQLNNKLDTLVGRCRGSSANDNGDYENSKNNNNENNNNQLMTTLAQFRSLSQDTLSTMVKKIESTENQLITSVTNSLEVPEKLSQVRERIEDNLSKLRSQVDGLSSNAPLIRLLRHIKQQLPDISRVTCMDDQTSELLEKATSQVNTMINEYTKQIESIGHSLTNVNTIVARMASLAEKYKKQYVQSSNVTNSGHLRTTVTSWE